MADKKEDIPDISQTINKALDKARDIGYNQGVDAAIEIVKGYDWILEPSPAFLELFSKLKALKK